MKVVVVDLAREMLGKGGRKIKQSGSDIRRSLEQASTCTGLDEGISDLVRCAAVRGEGEYNEVDPMCAAPQNWLRRALV